MKGEEEKVKLKISTSIVTLQVDKKIIKLNCTDNSILNISVQKDDFFNLHPIKD